MLTKTQKVIANQIKIHYAIIYHYTHTHDEDQLHHPQILRLASGTHTEWILNRDKKHNEIYQKKKQRNCYKGKTLTAKLIHVLCQPQI